jgi:hypothetical protein
MSYFSKSIKKSLIYKLDILFCLCFIKTSSFVTLYIDTTVKTFFRSEIPNVPQLTCTVQMNFY